MLDKQTFFKVVSEALEIDSSKISLDSKQSDLEEWDSLGHLTILSAIDKSTEGKAIGQKR